MVRGTPGGCLPLDHAVPPHPFHRRPRPGPDRFRPRRPLAVLSRDPAGQDLLSEVRLSRFGHRQQPQPQRRVRRHQEHDVDQPVPDRLDPEGQDGLHVPVPDLHPQGGGHGDGAHRQGDGLVHAPLLQQDLVRLEQHRRRRLPSRRAGCAEALVHLDLGRARLQGLLTGLLGCGAACQASARREDVLL